MKVEEFLGTDLGEFVRRLILCNNMSDVANELEYLFAGLDLEIDSHEWDEVSDLYDIFYPSDINET